MTRHPERKEGKDRYDYRLVGWFSVETLGPKGDRAGVAGLELRAIDVPETAAFAHELDFVKRMTVGSRATAGQSSEEKHGDIHIAVICPHELMRAAMKWKILLPNPVHLAVAPLSVAPSRSLGG